MNRRRAIRFVVAVVAASGLLAPAFGRAAIAADLNGLGVVFLHGKGGSAGGFNGGIIAGVNGVAGAASSELTAVLANLADHEPWYQGVLEATAIGFGESAVLGVGGEGIKARLNEQLQVKVSEQSIQHLDTMVDRVQSIATTSNAYMSYATAAFFVVSGFSVWGVTQAFSGSRNS